MRRAVGSHLDAVTYVLRMILAHSEYGFPIPTLRVHRLTGPANVRPGQPFIIPFEGRLCRTVPQMLDALETLVSRVEQNEHGYMTCITAARKVRAWVFEAVSEPAYQRHYRRWQILAESLFALEQSNDDDSPYAFWHRFYGEPVGRIAGGDWIASCRKSAQGRGYAAALATVDALERGDVDLARELADVVERSTPGDAWQVWLTSVRGAFRS